MKTAHLTSRTYIVPVEDLLERFNAENKQQITAEQLIHQSGHSHLLPDILPTGEIAIGTIQGHSKAFTTKYYTAPENFNPIPRGREGGRKPIADEPTRRRNISITDADWEYAISIGDSASDGIRKSLEYYRQQTKNG